MANEMNTRKAKRCFVTVGATASFITLIRAVLDASFIKSLIDYGYTELRIQYGKDGHKTFDDYTWVLPDDYKTLPNGLTITGFDFDKHGLRNEMIAAKGVLTAEGATVTSGEQSSAMEGCVISHAGSGSILDAMRIQVPLVVVPNTDLLHNHQLELAEELAEQNYVVHGKTESLSDTLPQVELLREQLRMWPPRAGKDSLTPAQRLTAVVNDEMGWVD